MSSMHNILCDLSLGHISAGFSGIPQDTRFLFSNLTASSKLKLTGHLFGIGQDPFQLVDSTIGTSDDEKVAIFLGCYLQGLDIAKNPSRARRIISTLFPSSKRFYQALDRWSLFKKTDFQLHNIPEKFHDSVWRQFFAASIPVKYQEKLLRADFKYSSMSISRIAHALHGRMNTPKLDTRGFDFAIFQDSRHVELTNRTIPIIRYHDGLPFFSSDTMKDMYQTLGHSRSIRLLEASNSNPIYVCNSTSSLNDLSLISDKLASTAHVIPYFLPAMKKPEISFSILEDIVETRKSPSTLPAEKKTNTQLWFNRKEEIPKFIMTLSTIEPRKNIPGLIDAWLKLRHKTNEDIKLLVVGKPGWEFERTLNAMRPHVKKGDLMHLEGVAQHELPYLYAAASCFVFPSFGEGFGLPPNEAMQCDCPVAVSDIPAHRYSCGDAALYFNPYDIDGMVASIEQLLNTNKNSNMIKELIEKGHKNVDRYSLSTVLPQWENLFDKLKAERN